MRAETSARARALPPPRAVIRDRREHFRAAILGVGDRARHRLFPLRPEAGPDLTQAMDAAIDAAVSRVVEGIGE